MEWLRQVVRLLATIALTLFGLGACERAERSPVEFWVEGAATREVLWVRNAAGQVFEFDRSRRKGSSRLLAEAVVDIARSEGRLLGLQGVNGAEAFEVVDLKSGSAISPTVQLIDVPLALVVDRDITIVTENSLFRLERGAWRRIGLSQNLRLQPRAQQVTAASDNEGVIYVGFNRGEWGGGLQAIATSDGTVSDLQNVGVANCGACGPVTGLIRDDSHPRCVLASIGLRHFGSEGRIVRVCGRDVEVVFSEVVPPPRGMPEGAPSGTRPFFGIVATQEGWAAVSTGQIFQWNGRAVVRSNIPAFEQRQGLQLVSLGSDLIAVRTHLNRSMSLSGATPLLVRVER